MLHLSLRLSRTTNHLAITLLLITLQQNLTFSSDSNEIFSNEIVAVAESSIENNEDSMAIVNSSSIIMQPSQAEDFKEKIGRAVEEAKNGEEETNVENTDSDSDSKTEQRIFKNIHLMKFYLFNDPKNSNKKDTMYYNDIPSLKKSSYKSGLPVKFLIHGFQMNIKDKKFFKLVEEYLKLMEKEKFNLIYVDWADLAGHKLLAGTPLYPVAAENTENVGFHVGRFINFLSAQGRLKSYGDVHLIGFSLGAHVAGVCGDMIKRFFGGKIGRITGLDPAGPLFGSLTSLAKKLDETDAIFVDVIHTNAGTLGNTKTKGHVDFWPNGGSRQIECILDLIGTCSHYKSVEMFAASINEKKKYMFCNCRSWQEYQKKSCGKECSDPQYFGEHVSKSARGSYYLSTRFINGL